MAKYLVVVLLGALSAYGQNSSTPLTNETIIRMVQSGVPSDVIIRTIAAADNLAFTFLTGTWT